jgi:hypothetical protein
MEYANSYEEHAAQMARVERATYKVLNKITYEDGWLENKMKRMRELERYLKDNDFRFEWFNVIYLFDDNAALFVKLRFGDWFEVKEKAKQ